MSTNIEYFGLYGIRLPWDSIFIDENEDILFDRENNSPFFLIDGMSGKWIYFGHVFFHNRAYYGDGDEFGELTSDPIELAKIENEYKANFVKEFPKFEYLMNTAFTTMVFVHAS